MNYEEKYNQAIEAAKRELHCCGSLDCDAARQIFRLFPELRESEDERIRKEIIQSIQDNMCVIHKDKCIAWLEKQGEKSLKPQNRWKPSEEQMEALALAVHDAHGHSYYRNLFSLYNDLKKL